MIIVEQSAHLESFTPNALRLIERAGRTAYKSEARITDDSAADFVRMLIRRGHESVLEHASATVRMVTDRGILAEITRHRIASFTVESTRYCDYDGNGISVVLPEGINDDLQARKAWTEAMYAAECAYHVIRERGISPQWARSVLPTCTKTEIVVTANFREWRHILKLRLDKAAHPQMRALMRLVLDELWSAYPVVFEVSHVA